MNDQLLSQNSELRTQNSSRTHGLLNIAKPAGVSSRHVVTQLEHALKPLAVGHAGTLDPMATGVLVVGVGRGTKLIDYLHRFPKTYRASFLLGRSSDTEDITGNVTMLTDARAPSRAELDAAVPMFLGTIQQQPPAFSALKVAGKRAYKLARKGKKVELNARPVDVHRLEITRYEYPELQAEIECSSGTYIRSLGRDLARAVGSEAAMSVLSRTVIGPFLLSQAVAPEQINKDNLLEHLLPSLLAVGAMQRTPLSEQQVAELTATGVLFDLPLEATQFASDAEVAGIAPDGRLFAVLTPSRGDRWKVKVLVGAGGPPTADES
ncbi:tRNA pseudouridine(55) synthase TruB [Anatilimnocola floriformis]|uniref:tRNA pseudouridine(55) synthase TruB n=1 Tax=Anatilimnocola floriformis TaxID=2948575 RepID=UPI0020C283C0|nr:tRNA pseudouridine(55) synthase TruB [Anatilimnocola floriformis]